jgi:nucleoside-triphosphatase THEP1
MQLSENSPVPILASFISSNKPDLVQVTGKKGAGKTRWCVDLIEYARTLDLKPRGLISPAIFENGRKVGIDLMDLSSGERRRLAYLAGTADGDLQTTDWRMVTKTLDWGNSILEKIRTCDLFVLDEVGPLEFELEVGLTVGLDILDSHKNFPSVVVIRPSLLKAAYSRWPWGKVVDLSSGATA